MERPPFTAPGRLAVLAAALAAALPLHAQDASGVQSIVVVGGTNYQAQQVLKPDVFEGSSHVQETSPGLKSPYIGAFTGNQVDLTLNGIRMNNALFRGGPNQYYSWVPTSFTRYVTVSDGGNVGGTIGRELGIADSRVGLGYDTANKAASGTASIKTGLLGAALYTIHTDDLRSASGTTPHSAYNQNAVMLEGDWSATQRTLAVFSSSHDIERTDKWNGGRRSSGVQAPAVYTWQLQQYGFLNHHLTLDALDVNLGVQNFLEHILDGTKHVRTDLTALTANFTYRINRSWSAYSTNTQELIDYDNAVTAVNHDHYRTSKQGVRLDLELGGFTTHASLGLKQVKVNGFSGFNSTEGSLIVARGPYFASLAADTNPPGYASLKQSTTSGRGTSVPNPDLKEEKATTLRLGHNTRSLYADVYVKHFAHSITSTTVAANTFKPVNGGAMNVHGITVAFDLKSVGDSGVDLAGRVETVGGHADVFGTSRTEPLSKVPAYSGFVKATWHGAFAEFKYAPVDHQQPSGDLDDVRIYAFNHGYKLLNIGYGASTANVDWKVAVNNITNNDGRVLGSSTNVPERSLAVSAAYRF